MEGGVIFISDIVEVGWLSKWWWWVVIRAKTVDNVRDVTMVEWMWIVLVVGWWWLIAFTEVDGVFAALSVGGFTFTFLLWFGLTFVVHGEVCWLRVAVMVGKELKILIKLLG